MLLHESTPCDSNRGCMSSAPLARSFASRGPAAHVQVACGRFSPLINSWQLRSRVARYTACRGQSDMAASEPVAKQEELPVWHAHRCMCSTASWHSRGLFALLSSCLHKYLYTAALNLSRGWCICAPLSMPRLCTGNRRQAAPHTIRWSQRTHQHQGHSGGGRPGAEPGGQEPVRGWLGQDRPAAGLRRL